MTTPPLPKYDQEVLDALKLTIDATGNILYKGVVVTVCYDPDWKLFYYLLAKTDHRAYSLKKAFSRIDAALAKLEELGEPWD
jgi:hypothetical protein